MRWLWTVLIVTLPVGLACAGVGGGSSTTVVSAPTTVEAYEDLAFTTWRFREKGDWYITHDEKGVPAKNFGTVREGVVKGFEGSAWTWDFGERQYPTKRLDTCHVGFTGAFEGHQMRRATRSWPPCDGALCTYDDLPFTVWEVDGFSRGKKTITIDHAGSVSAWLSEEAGTATRTSGGMKLTWPSWSIELTRLDKCHYGGSGTVPGATAAVTWQMSRAWPACGCP